MIVPTPLRKTTTDGFLYNRVAITEALLLDLIPLSRDDLIARCEIRERDDPAFVPNEGLLYFVRESREDSSDSHFERLYTILAERVLFRLPREGGSDGLIRDAVFGRFVDLVAEDRSHYSEKLDFFEIRFDSALCNLRLDAQRKIWRDENRSANLEVDEETGELSAEVELSAGSFDCFDFSNYDGADYRSWLDAAIDALPPEQRRIIEMIRNKIPIDSIDPEAVTIAKTLGKSEKTIRTHRDKAYATLRTTLKEEENL